MDKDIAKSAMERIKKLGITPESKATVMLRRLKFWAPTMIAGALAAVAIAAIYFNLDGNDWDLFPRLGFGFILHSVPYFWIVAFVILVVLGDFYYGKTEVGYRYSFVRIAGIFILVTMLFGSLLMYMGAGRIFQRSIRGGGGVLQNMMFQQTEVWSHPEQGLLAGTIRSVATTSFELTDFENKVWAIDMTNALVRSRVQLVPGTLVKVIGQAAGDQFIASEVRPWMGQGMMNGSGVHGGMFGGAVGGAGRKGMMR